MSASAPLVHIVTLTGEDYDDTVQAAETEGGPVDAVSRSPAQRDTGTEADDATLLWPEDMPPIGDLESQPFRHPLEGLPCRRSRASGTVASGAPGRPPSWPARPARRRSRCRWQGDAPRPAPLPVRAASSIQVVAAYRLRPARAS